MKRLAILFLLCANTGSIYSQGTISVAAYFRYGFVFESGYWVYRDSATNELDSVSLVNCVHNFIYPNPAIPDYQEYYKMNFYSHSFNYSFNEFIITNYWKRNGGGEWGQLGQPVMHIGQYANYPEVGNGFNGYQIMDIFPSYEVNEIEFSDVVWSRVFENQQYQHEFDYDTDLYFAPGVGIIRKAYVDDQGVNHAWDLVNWQSNIYTSINDEWPSGKEIVVYPVPAGDIISVTFSGMLTAEILNLHGVVVCRSAGRDHTCVFDLKDLSPGVYIVKVFASEGIFTRKIIVRQTS